MNEAYKNTRGSDDCDQSFQAAQDIEIDAVADARPLSRTAQQAGLLQDTQMLGDGGLGQGKFVDNLPLARGAQQLRVGCLCDPYPRGTLMGIVLTGFPVASNTALPMAGAMAMMGVSPAPADSRSLRSSRSTSVLGRSRKRGTR